MQIAIYRFTPFLPLGNPVPFQPEIATEWFGRVFKELVNRNHERLIRVGVNTDLAHNHDEKTSNRITRYPLINYHYFDEVFIITGINEGKNLIEELIKPWKCLIDLEKNKIYFRFEFLEERKLQVRNTSNNYSYSLINWLPFKTEPYEIFKSTQSIIEKTRLLEERLQKHLVNDLNKILNPKISTPTVIITGIDSFDRTMVPVTEDGKKHYFQPFTIRFDTNVDLVDFTTLGNHKAYGFGRVMRNSSNISLKTYSNKIMLKAHKTLVTET